MADTPSALLESISTRDALEAFTLEIGPAVFQSHAGERTEGLASVQVTRQSITIRFRAADLTVPKAGYGESNGKVFAADGSWSAPDVNDAGRAANGDHLLGTMLLEVGHKDRAPVAATRLVIAGGDWSGTGTLDGRRVVVAGLSKETVSHHDRRLSVSVDGCVDAAASENWGRACSFITGIDMEVLRVEAYSADGQLQLVKHQRGFRRVGRSPHSPFTGVAAEHRMEAFLAVAGAIPRLRKEGFPIDLIVDQVSAHNQVAQIHVSAPLLLMATSTAAHYVLHRDDVGPGAASRRPELEALNARLALGLDDAAFARFERLRVELLDAGYFHAPGYETGRPQKDIKFIRDITHTVILRLCGYSGPYYGAESFAVRELARA
jgi:hypothetical protein